MVARCFDHTDDGNEQEKKENERFDLILICHYWFDCAQKVCSSFDSQDGEKIFQQWFECLRMTGALV